MSKKDKTRITGFKPPITYPKYAWQVKTEKFFNFDAKFEPTELPDKLETTQKWITYPTRYKVTFPLQTIRPKVQKLRIVEPFRLPKDVAVGRKRKKYAKIDFNELLQQKEINNIDLYPVDVIEKIYPNGFKSENIFNIKSFLPLSWFDNRDLDIYNEKGWLDLGMIDGEQHPLPALGFVPNLPYVNNEEILVENIAELILENFEIDQNDYKNYHPELYTWRLIAVWEYDEKTDLWRVTDLENYKSYRISRIYFKFIAEDPVNYVNRLKIATQLRKDNQTIIKFEAILDVFFFLTKFPRQKYIERLIDKIFDLTLTKKHLHEVNKNFLEFLKEMVRFQINRHNLRYEFEQYLDKQAEFKYLDINYLELAKPKKKPYKREVLIDDFEQRKLYLTFHSFYYCSEIIHATNKVTKECLNLETYTLFPCQTFKPVSIDEFLSMETYHVNKIVQKIRGYWTDEISEHVHILLRQTGKGWMDVYLKDWFTFKCSKISAYLNQIQTRMEDSLQFFLENSIKCFMNMLNAPCSQMLKIRANYKWDSDFKTSPFASSTHPPVFSASIGMSENGATLSTNPQDFLPAVANLFKSSLILCTPIPIINSRVMLNLVYAKNIYLDCGEDIDNLFHVSVAILTKSYNKAIIPLISYIHKYDEFKELYYLDIPTYIQNLKEQNHPANVLKEIIINNKKLKKEIFEMLPQRIIIGPFSINVETIKMFLYNKYQSIIDALLIFYTERMREINETLLDNLQYIYHKISEKVNSIEHLLEIKDFISTIPSQLEACDDKIKIMNYEYDILEFFLYNLSNEQFDMKWQVFAYPHRILKKISEVNEQHKNDIELFKKIQISELASYQDRLESINEEVGQFGYVFDTNKLEENAVDVKKLLKTILELEKLGRLLQSRQEIFELDEYSLEFIMNIKASFQPYFDLWTSSLGVVKLEEVCIGNPMNSLDMIDIKNQFDGFLNMFQSLYRIFDEKPEIQNVASIFIDRIQKFGETVEVLDWLKNENWLPMHWLELNQRGKIEIKYSQNINLQLCIKKGILKHVELVREIGTVAVEQADAIRQAFEDEEKRKREIEEEILQRKMARKCRRDIL